MCNQEGTTQTLPDSGVTDQLTESQLIVNKAFGKFLEVFIKSRKSLIVEYKNGEEVDTFSVDDINNCLNFLMNVETLNPKDKKVSLQQKLEELSTKKRGECRKNYILLWHCYWIMYLMNDTSKTFLNKDAFGLSELNPQTNLFIEKGKEIASTKQVYSKEPIRPFRFLLGLIKDVWSNEKIELKLDIIKNYYFSQNDANRDDRIKNILLYLCDPNKYPCIISQAHQNAIYENLSFLLSEGKEPNDLIEKAEVVKNIETHLKDKNNTGIDIKSLYDDSIKRLWFSQGTNFSTNGDDELPQDTLLKYKKAIVLYGPPGTSKSYMARELAKNLIGSSFAETLKKSKNKKEDFIKFQEALLYIYDEQKKDEQKRDEDKKKKKDSDSKPIPHIHRLQLHPGYTYDDFIVGRTIEEKSVKLQRGYLIRLIDNIKNDVSSYASLPHILILDEINRVDISRVFGELFTAMEKDYRETGVDLPVTDKENEPLKLKVPENLYIIGTMNMIDFSLEQVDFALRRRFAWIESNYDDDRLKEIIEEKSKDINGISSDEFMPFVTVCTKLNEKISNEPSLGPAYQIGHAFFSEIVDIYSDIKSEGKQNPWEVAKKVLWSISVRPTLDAYCGSMETEQKKQFIEGCKNAFLPKVKDKVKDSKSKQTDVELSSENE